MVIVHPLTESFHETCNVFLSNVTDQEASSLSPGRVTAQQLLQAFEMIDRPIVDLCFTELSSRREAVPRFDDKVDMAVGMRLLDNGQSRHFKSKSESRGKSNFVQAVKVRFVLLQPRHCIL